MTETKMNQMMQVLKDAHLSFRKIPSRKGNVFFCEKKDMATFDVEMTEQRQLEAWSYIAEGISKNNHRMRWEFRAEDHEDTIVGLEVTNEGILNLFFRQKMIDYEEAAEVKEQEIRIVNRLESFAGFLKGFKTVMKEDGLRVINEPSGDCIESGRNEKESMNDWNSGADEKDECQDEIFTAVSRKLDMVFGRHQGGEMDMNAKSD